MPAAASHVITAAVLLDVLPAVRALLHTDAHDLLRVQVRDGLAAGALRAPLVLAHEAHDRVIAEVAHAHAVMTRAIHLHGRWVQHVLLQAYPKHQVPLQAGERVRGLLYQQPERLVDAVFAHSTQAAYHHCALCDAMLTEGLGPPRPALLACSMAHALSSFLVVEQGDPRLAADGTYGARLRRPCGPEGKAAPTIQLGIGVVAELDAFRYDGAGLRELLSPEGRRDLAPAALVAAAQAQAPLRPRGLELQRRSLTPALGAGRVSALDALRQVRRPLAERAGVFGQVPPHRGRGRELGVDECGQRRRLLRRFKDQLLGQSLATTLRVAWHAQHTLLVAHGQMFIDVLAEARQACRVRACSLKRTCACPRLVLQKFGGLLCLVTQQASHPWQSLTGASKPANP
mmetsp:Transcript_65673/g.185588  ORF Transcript_65673/g.185588 Transcript_65673/m.185588 type:complete len:401 (-) Transcript_65673:10-1212(-)